jgi:DNA repair exonuclease SbcCD ATPase subunit
MIEFLEIFFFGRGDVQIAIAPVVGAALISGGIQVIGSIFGSGRRRRAERAAQQKQARLQRKLSSLEANRQAITNPYSGVSNLSGLAQDLSSNLTNPYANLSVATQAAEIQIEQADISLANTLDTLRSTGSGAGGATALAQAALQSKKGVSASIEQQEANNEKLRAQGEQQLDRMRMQEAARVQGIQISEGGRVQGLEAAGKQFMFGAQEEREMQQLDRVSAQLSGAQASGMQASADRRANQAGLIGGLASLGGSLVTGLASQQANPYNNSASLDTGSTAFTDSLSGGMFDVNTGGGFNSNVGQIDFSNLPN